MHLAIEWEAPCSVTLMRQLQLFAHNFHLLCAVRLLAMFACLSAIKMQLTRLSLRNDSSVSRLCQMQLATAAAATTP